MRGIVVGVDGSRESERALEWAVTEARLRKTSVSAVHVWTYPYFGAAPITPPILDQEQIEADARALLEAVVSKVATEGVTIHARLYEGSAGRCLLDAAKDAELLVVGSRGRGGFAELLLGSVSHQVAHHAPCPVVIVPAPR